MQNSVAFTTFKELLRTDLKIFKQTFGDKLFDLGIWVSTVAFVNSYLMPAFGLSPAYTNFIIAGLCASAGLFEVWPSAVNIISDLDGDRIINYHLTLPMPSWLFFMELICSYAISSAALSIFVVPFSKIILWNRFDLSNFHLGKFILIFTLTNIFYAAFTLFIASLVSGMKKIGTMWMRLVYPLWFLGCFQFSWLVLFKQVPILAYINLFNPLTYIMEGIRSAILGTEGYLPFSACLIMLTIFTIMCIVIAIKRFKKRLDFV